MTTESDDRTLFVGNLDKNVSDEILYELFLQAGPIERVNIPPSRNDSRFGFVTYKHDCSIPYAIELFKGTTLFKKELHIKKRCPKTNNSDMPKPGINLDCLRYPPEVLDFQKQLLSIQLLAQNLNHPQRNFTSESLKASHRTRYDSGMKDPISRPRYRHKERDYGNKMYHSRKNRHRN